MPWHGIAESDVLVVVNEALLVREGGGHYYLSDRVNTMVVLGAVVMATFIIYDTR